MQPVSHSRAVCWRYPARRFGRQRLTFAPRVLLGALLVFAGLGVSARQPTPGAGVIRQTIDEDGSPRAFVLELRAQDSDGDAVVWSISEQGAHGVATVEGAGATRSFRYDPAPDWHGVDRFTIQISDERGGVNSVDVEVTVVPQNDPPRNTSAPTLSGTPEAGQELGVDPGRWDDGRDGGGRSFHLSFQWQVARQPLDSAAVNVPDATGWTFGVREEHTGLYIRVVVTATEQGAAPLSAQAASGFFKVGNAAPVFVQVGPAPPEPSVTVKEVVFSGNESIPTPELQPLVADVVGRDVTLTELKAASDVVTAEYRRRDMSLAKAYVPAQEVGGDGRVKFQVVEGKAGWISVDGNHLYSEDFIRKHIAAALSDGPVSNRQLERALLILNEEYRGLNVQTVLKRGQEPGTVDIQAQVDEEKRWRGHIGYNNFGSESVSRHRILVGADANNLLLDGDLLALLAVLGDEPDELANGAVTYRVPLNHLGTQLGVRFAAGSYEVSQDFVDLGLEGQSVSGGLFVTHPFIKQRALRLSGEFGIEATDSRYDILRQTASSDRIRAVYASLIASGSHWGGDTSAILNVTQGLGEFAGGMDDDAESPSRPEANNSFTRATLSLNRLQQLCRYAALLARLDGQLASDPLVASQEWQIGGAHSVRGYAPGEVTGDQGFLASLELQVTPFPSRPYGIVAFVDHGYARRKETFIAEPEDLELTGAGLGVRLAHDHRLLNGSLRLDVGWPVGSVDSSLDNEPSLYLATELRF